MDKLHKKYLLTLFKIVFFVVFLMFLINILIDPLWYFYGNKLFNENYSFNERFSKVNQYLKKSQEYDCVLFGSSRVTLLNSNDINEYNCFNFSFSDGTPNEYVEYAKYVKKYGGNLNRAIVGIDMRFFSRENKETFVPDFVKSLDYPPNFIKSYLSLNSIDFSIRTLFRNAPQYRYYNAQLIGDVLPGTKGYQPPPCFTLEGFGIPYNPDKIQYLEDIKSILQAKSFTGYVAPISAWDMMPLLEDGQLDSYLYLVYTLAKTFDQFYDFSIPSVMTERTDNNYDGHHYTPRANNVVIEALNGQKGSTGLAVHEMNYADYQRAFKAAMHTFKKKIGLRKKSSKSCSQRSANR